MDVRVVKGESGAYEVRVDYRDGETICAGVLDVKTGKIVGNVRQLEAGEEGYEYPSQDVTHTFNLAAIKDSGAVTRQRAAVYQAQRACTEYLGTWRPQSFDTLPSFRIHLGAWSTAFDGAVVASEATLAELRNKTRVLQDVTYTSPVDRLEKMQLLHTVGCTRKSAHAAIDVGLLAMRQGVMLPERLRVPFDPIERPGSPFPGRSQRYEFHKMLIRGSACYQKFDEALGSACRRVPLSVLDGWVVEGGAPDAECAICITEIDDDDLLVRLPCRHSFHKECIVKWSHTSSFCPNCRGAMQPPSPDTPSPCP